VGEGKVGKTTLLKALTGKEPQKDEKTTRGVSIEVQALPLPHPKKDGITIQFNAWDFGGQETYRVTHQFFFSRRSVYLVVWEPRLGVQQCQVQDWLKMIRLRVGEDARVIIVSTHCRTDERIARIDKDVFRRDFPMIVDFLEVDSLTPDSQTGEMVGIAELKKLIAQTASSLEQMGMEFNRYWREARDEILARKEPRITYEQFAAICTTHGLDAISAKTLADLMHDLGYIVFYSNDERLKDDVVLQPEWLTKAISFVLEDLATQDKEGILEDQRLKDVWYDHPHQDEPRYDPLLYPFFLRLMEKYDVLYRLEDGKTSLVAQHVPQVRPDMLPWLPESALSVNTKRISLICQMEENPPGLIPWMIVRTHLYTSTIPGVDGKVHRLHWQKGMFLNYKVHTSAMLELRGDEFHIYVQAAWPKKFTTILRETLQKLIDDNWPGLKDRYSFVIPCKGQRKDAACSGRFPIDFLQHMLEEMGITQVPCQKCFQPQDVESLLYGFEREDERQEFVKLQQKVERFSEEIKDAVTNQTQLVRDDITKFVDKVDYYFMAFMRAIATEAKHGPRLFTMEPLGGWKTYLIKPMLTRRYQLQLWCEASGCEHPVLDEDKGIYKVDVPHEWVKRVAPYANFIASVLKTLLPMTAPAINLFLGDKGVESLGIKEELELMKEGTGKLLPEMKISDSLRLQQRISEDERSGLLALHAILRDKDPHHENLGLLRVATYTGDYQWLCRKHYEESQSKIPDQIPTSGN
jgi:internalin A